MRRRRNNWQRKPNNYYNPQYNQYNQYNNQHHPHQNYQINQHQNRNRTQPVEIPAVVKQVENTDDTTIAGNCDNTTLNDSQTELSSVETQQNVQQEDADEQGKSTGINPDQTSNNIDIQPDIENENVQCSAPSPNANDGPIENVNENPVTNDEQEVTDEPTPATEPSETIEEIQQTEIQEEGEEPKEEFQSEYISENGEERSHTPEIKQTEEKVSEKKRITLKRPRRPSSPLEDGEIKEPQDKSSKKITLKRRGTNDVDFIDKIVINRRPSGDEKADKRRLSGEEKTHIVIARPTKPAKPVKLKRPLSCLEDQESTTPPRSHKLPWGKSNWLDNISATTYKIDVDTIKVVCPSVEFLNESEVKLEEIPKDPVRHDSESSRKKIEEEQKTDESEKEHSEEEDSTEEQKFEANPNIIALNRKISIVDDTAAKMQPPPSPAKNPVSEILYITNLVRPFTLKQLKELLERTGKIKENGIWTDKIKSKCYAHYENVEEAELTRNALHGVNWPIGNGKQLIIEYATEEDMEKAKNPVPLPIIIPDKLPEKENREPQVLEVKRKERGVREKIREQVKEERKREPSDREWIKSRDEHRRRHSRSRSKSRERVRKHSRRSYTPLDINRKAHKSYEDSVPQKLMDDLFLKTKSTPSIYWQPLSPQEIATKQQQRLVRMEEHKRRVEETRTRFRERDRRGTFRRR